MVFIISSKKTIMGEVGRKRRSRPLVEKGFYRNGCRTVKADESGGGLRGLRLLDIS
jgi:hypothetical protein